MRTSQNGVRVANPFQYLCMSHIRPQGVNRRLLNQFMSWMLAFALSTSRISKQETPSPQYFSPDARASFSIVEPNSETKREGREGVNAVIVSALRHA